MDIIKLHSTLSEYPYKQKALCESYHIQAEHAFARTFLLTLAEGLIVRLLLTCVDCVRDFSSCNRTGSVSMLVQSFLSFEMFDTDLPLFISSVSIFNFCSIKRERKKSRFPLQRLSPLSLHIGSVSEVFPVSVHRPD